jgi:membrane-associated protease RseP (regulator of RpoE activity)
MSVQTAPAAFAEDLASRLRAGLAGLFAVADTTVAGSRPYEIVRFRGRFLVPAEQAYERVRAHFSALGYTPVFRREAGEEVVIAGPGTIEVSQSRWWINVVLFALTVLSVIFVGALSALPPEIVRAGDAAGLRWALSHWTAGLPYAAALLAILLCHEFGHYLVARRHGVAVSLPYFIPMPFGLLGTMGAAIVQKEPMRNRKVLFDVGVAGPLAGLLVAVPILVYGLAQSPLMSIAEMKALYPQLLQEGNSILYLGLKYLVFGQQLPSATHDVLVGPAAFAGWVGLLVTALNLLPAGQLDGGHVAYVLFGERTRQLSQIVIFALLLLGGLPIVLAQLGVIAPVGGTESWLIWALLISVFGRGHPPLLDELTPLDNRRRALAWAMLAIFVLVFTPLPLRLA